MYNDIIADLQDKDSLVQNRVTEAKLLQHNIRKYLDPKEVPEEYLIQLKVSVWRQAFIAGVVTYFTYMLEWGRFDFSKTHALLGRGRNCDVNKEVGKSIDESECLGTTMPNFKCGEHLMTKNLEQVD